MDFPGLSKKAHQLGVSLPGLCKQIKEERGATRLNLTLLYYKMHVETFVRDQGFPRDVSVRTGREDTNFQNLYITHLGPFLDPRS